MGSGKTPVGHSREEKRTAEPGRRLGKSCFFSRAPTPNAP